MKTVTLILVISITTIMNLYGQDHDRHPVVSGSFYPSESGKLRSELADYFSSFDTPAATADIRAIIAPHAGYAYSGRTAAAAYAAIPGSAEYDNIFLIGVSHRSLFEGAAVFTTGDLITPLGRVKVNKEIGEQLKRSNKWFIKKDDAHLPEHSLEVHLPFIQYHFRSVPQVVPLLIGTRTNSILKAVAKGLQPWFNERNLFIISSDFSHYPSYSDAIRVDAEVCDAIIRNNPDEFLRTINRIESAGTKNLVTAMCGWPAGVVLLYLTEKSDDLSFRRAYYTNSGDSPPGSKNEVVGYNSIILEKREREQPGSAGHIRTKASQPSGTPAFLSLTAIEQRSLLKIARESVTSHLNSTERAVPDKADLTTSLLEPLGAFVTITNNGELCGCIGSFISSGPLWQTVSSMAAEAAFNDPRFKPLTGKEYPSVCFEISIIGPMKRVTDIKEIEPGKHGIYLKKGGRSGTFLPQVAGEHNWNVEQMLSFCSRDKAGIGWNGWKEPDTEIFIYEAFVFNEEGNL